MAFAPTPPRTNAPSQLLPLSALLGANGAGSNVGTTSGLTIISPPSTGNVGVALSVAGTVSPNNVAVQVGLALSASVAPTNWTPANVSGGGWTASITPAAAGTYYIWAEESGTGAIQTVSAGITITGNASIAFTNPPVTGTSGADLALAGTVSPAGSAVRVGLSTSATVAPTSFTAASVSGTGWTAAISSLAAGTFYLWVEQTSTPSVYAVSAAVTIVAGGSPLTYSLIGGSGNGSLTTTSLSNTSFLTADWTSEINHGATDIAPNVQPSSMGSIASCKFWFDTSATSTTVPSSNYGNSASVNNGVLTFYPASAFATPTGVPAAPATLGTYYGKYAMYDSGNDLLGIYVTSAISIV